MDMGRLLARTLPSPITPLKRCKPPIALVNSIVPMDRTTQPMEAHSMFARRYNSSLQVPQAPRLSTPILPVLLDITLGGTSTPLLTVVYLKAIPRHPSSH